MPDLVHALSTAKDLLRRYPDMSLATALAQATTTAQCRGVDGYLVYRDVRQLIADSEGLSTSAAAAFTESVRDSRAVAAVDKAMREANA